MTLETLAYVVHAHGAPFELRRVEIGPVGPDEVLVAMKATGICHTDILAAAGDIPVHTPIILGHEGIGEVFETGARVSQLAKGDLVMLSFASCSHCRNCASGRPTLCRYFLELNLFGMKVGGASLSAQDPLDDQSNSTISHTLSTKFFGQSSLAKFINVNARSCIKLDRSKLRSPSGTETPLSHLAPFGCGFMTGAGTVLNVCKPSIGSSIAVFGAGAVGLAAIASAAHLSAANTIIAVDVNDTKLSLASAVGATLCINSKQHADQGAAAIKEATVGHGLEFALDTTGNAEVIAFMLKCLGPNGSGIQVAGPMSGKAVEIHPSFLVNSSLTYRGVIEGDTNPAIFLPALVEHYVSGRFPIGTLIKEYRHDQLQKALSDIKQGLVVKAVLVWD